MHFVEQEWVTQCVNVLFMLWASLSVVLYKKHGCCDMVAQKGLRRGRRAARVSSHNSKAPDGCAYKSQLKFNPLANLLITGLQLCTQGDAIIPFFPPEVREVFKKNKPTFEGKKFATCVVVTPSMASLVVALPVSRTERSTEYIDLLLQPGSRGSIHF